MLMSQAAGVVFSFSLVLPQMPFVKVNITRLARSFTASFSFSFERAVFPLLALTLVVTL